MEQWNTEENRLPPALEPFAQSEEWLEREIAERSLADFTESFWPYADPRDFVRSWHIDIVADHLEAVSRREIRRLIITIPPRTSKSTMVSVMWPAWEWQRQPRTSFLFASYGLNLSTRDSGKCSKVMKSPKYQQFWGDKFRIGTDRATKIDNDHMGYRLATSVDGALTGEGADIVGIDDPLNAKDALSEPKRLGCNEWFKSSMTTRLNDAKTGAFVMVMQRLHHEDLPGVLLKEGGRDWYHLCLPMRYEPDHKWVFHGDPRTEDGELLCPERFDEEEVELLEEDLGSYAAAGQLQQRPTPREGGMFKRRWWKYVDAAPAGGRIVRGWDLAATETTGAPFTCSVRMKLFKGCYYIEHVDRFRGTPMEVENAIFHYADEDGKRVTIDLPQDPGQAGKAQVRLLIKRLRGWTARSSPESGSKETRAEPFSAQVEAGNVFLVRGDWNDDFVRETSHFPLSDYSDQVDASSRAFHRLNTGRASVPLGQGDTIS